MPSSRLLARVSAGLPAAVSIPALRPQRARLTRPLAWMGAFVCAAAVAVSAAGSPADAAFGRGLLEFLIVGVPIAAGIYALRAPGNASFGIALLAIGFLWSLTALGQTSASIPYTVGRIATWCIFPGVVYLLLAFPDGRIAPGWDRIVFCGVLGVLGLLFIGTAPLVEAFPAKTLWATCTTDCPPNAVFLLEQQPAWLPKLILVREWLVEVLWLGLFWSMLRRFRAASALQRRAMAPVFIAGTFLGVFHIGHITYRQLGGPTDTVIALSSAWTVCIVGVCATFLYGLVRRRTRLASALTRLGGELHAGTSSAQIHGALRTALNDLTAQSLFRTPDGGWRDASGTPVPWPEPMPGRSVTAIADEDGSQALLVVHDVALRDDPELLDAVSAVVLAAWRHERMMDDLSHALSDLAESRRRIAEAADRERVRIERDLHDGAQQRLLALRIRLSLLEDTLQRDPAAGIEGIRELGFEAERALEELRSLAHGVYPSLLLDRGPVDALRSMALQTPASIRVAADGVTRHPIEIESAVYFTCVEAAQNAIKHTAPNATGIWITLTQTPGALHFEVRDDGPGFDPRARDGRGLRNMRDRMGAVGGRLTIDSRPGHGTRVAGGVDL
jgi:signal transduction histidine kinase